MNRKRILSFRQQQAKNGKHFQSSFTVYFTLSSYDQVGTFVGHEYAAIDFY